MERLREGRKICWIWVMIAVSTMIMHQMPQEVCGDLTQQVGEDKDKKPDPAEMCDETEEEEEVVNDDDLGFAAFFINQHSSESPVSLFWHGPLNDELVELSIPYKGSVKVVTFTDHEFYFSTQGTRQRIGDIIKVKPNQDKYYLSPEALISDSLECEDRNRARCQYDAKRGECEKNPGWMIVNCPVSCNKCDLLDPKKRCDRSFLNITIEPLYGKSGELNQMFENIIVNYPEFSPQVMSRPPEGPWVIVFENFLSEEESNNLISWGHKLGYQRSTDTGPINARGESQRLVSSIRTSGNAWCQKDCAIDPLNKRISERISQMTKSPIENYEQFQILQYQEGQYYKIHHDMIEEPKNFYGGGPRILTFFLYLSDVEEGGETNFPALDLSIKPKRGRAVLWNSVLDGDPYKSEPDAIHEARPVIKGVKYAANHWIHTHNFLKSNLWGCTGAFT